MFYNDDKKKPQNKKPQFNAGAFKHAIGMVESSGGKNLMNTSSSASGKYQFLYNLIRRDPDMKGVSRRDFINNPDLQERIMDKALAGKLDGYAYGERYSQRLQDKYKTNYNLNEVGAIVHFLGPGNARRFLKDPTTFKVPGKTNASVEEYLGRFNKNFNHHELENSYKIGSDFDVESFDNKSPRDIHLPKMTQPIDNTRVSQPRFQEINYKERSNDFRDGGYVDPPTKKDRQNVMDYIDNMNKDADMKSMVDIVNSQSMRSSDPKQGLRSKAMEVALNPMTAAGYIARGQKLPDNFSRGERNPLDYAVDVVNPFQYVNDAKNLVQGSVSLDGAQALEGALGVLPVNLAKKSISSKTKKLINNFTKKNKNFKSDIDWAKWNKEIPENKALMQEYNAIEKQAKANNTWMKNPDGSEFKGGPEQFVQQNSKNFKKVFPNIIKDSKGNIQTNFHGSPNEFNEFIEDLNPAYKTGERLGKGIYTTPKRGMALEYAFKNKEKKGKLYELYQNSNNPQDFIESFEKMQDLKTSKIKKILENKKSTKSQLLEAEKEFNKVIEDQENFYENLKDSDFKLKKENDYFKSGAEQVVPYTNYPKSMKGNNGMFDMSNPNIYKAILPAVGAGTAMSSQGNKLKQGGYMQPEQSGASRLVTLFEGGGSHEENSLGGIPQGTGSNGKQNLVEEGETKWNDYIFSNAFDMEGNYTGKEGNKTNLFEKGGELNPDPIKNELKKKENFKKNNLSNSTIGLIRDYNKEDNTNSNRFQSIHENSDKSCLAGALNCGTGGSGESGFGFLNEYTEQRPSLRSYLEKGNIEKYRTKDVKTSDIEGFVPNTSIDAWEYHQYMRGEGLGYDPYKDVEFTYKKDGILPDQIYDNPSAIPVGTVIGQGMVNNKFGYDGYDDANETKGRNRHAMVVIGYDKKDGMPLVYDYGEERRLDDVKFKRSLSGKHKKITNFTTPNEYSNLNYKNIKSSTSSRKVDLGYSGDSSKDYTSLNSSHEPVLAIEKGANESASGISDFYNVPKTSIDKMIKLLPGLSFTETKLNNNEGTSYDGILPTSVTDSFWGNNMLKPYMKGLMNTSEFLANTLRDDDSKRKQNWELEIEAYDKYGKDTEKRNEYLNKLIDSSKGDKGYKKYESSVGAFKIKDLSRFAKKNKIKKSDLYGSSVSNEKELEIGSTAALSLLSEKYSEAVKNTKKMELNLTEDQLIKLSFVGYKNNKKFKSKKYIENYILDKYNKGLEDLSFNAVKNYKIKK